MGGGMQGTGNHAGCVIRCAHLAFVRKSPVRETADRQKKTAAEMPDRSCRLMRGCEVEFGNDDQEQVLLLRMITGMQSEREDRGNLVNQIQNRREGKGHGRARAFFALQINSPLEFLHRLADHGQTQAVAL